MKVVKVVRLRRVLWSCTKFGLRLLCLGLWVVRWTVLVRELGLGSVSK